jgi:hypothetical protein
LPAIHLATFSLPDPWPNSQGENPLRANEIAAACLDLRRCVSLAGRLALLDCDSFIADVKKARGKKRPLSAAGLGNLRDEYGQSIEPARALAAEALNLENEIGNLVNQAYGLTPEEVALMWETAPPRMPIAGPA